MNHLLKLKEIKTLSCPQVNRQPDELEDKKEKLKKLKKFIKICFGISLGYILLVLAMCL